MSNKVLSICIPTYNRGEYLDELLNSIELQMDDYIKEKIDICISDNCSTDNTDEIVNKHILAGICNINYHKNKENLGADNNYLKVVDISDSEYCWWIGSDDALEDNILLELVDKLLLSKYDFYMLTQNCYDSKLQNKFKCNYHPLLKNNEDILLSKKDILTDAIYLLGYLSVLIVRKDIFIKEMPKQNEYIGSMYVHTYKILYALNQGSKMFYIRKPYIKWRADNDSFLDDLKLFGRIKIDIVGYSSIAADVFGIASQEYKEIVKVRVVNKSLRHILVLKLNKVSKEKIMTLYDCIKQYPFYYFYVNLLASIPSSFALLARYIYRKTIKSY